MALTALEMVKRAETELGLPTAQSVFGVAAARTDIQMGGLLNRCLDELRRMTNWTAMQFEFDLVVSPPTITIGDLAPGSAVISNIPTTAGLIADAYQVLGPGIPSAARVQTIDSPTQITMNMINTNADPLVQQSISFCRDTYPMAPGFDWFNNRTMWDRTNRWELLGPDSPQMDQWHRSGIVVTGPRRHFRQVGPHANSFRIWPSPAEIKEPLQLTYEYLSNTAVSVHGADPSQPITFAQYFEHDDDIPLLDDQAIIMGIKWMFWEAKGFNFVPMQNRWTDYVTRLSARDGAAPTLSVVKRVHPIFISPANVQDGFFPGPVGPNAGT